MRRVQTHVGSLSGIGGDGVTGGKKRSKAKYVYARMSSKNPYLGTFHHAPPAGNVGAKYFQMQLTSEEEIQKQKAYRNNPLIGTFHPHPRAYSKLNFSKFRLRSIKEEKDEKRDMTKRPRVFTEMNEQKDTGSVCAVGKSKSIVNTWDSWEPKTFHNKRGSPSDTSRESAKQESKSKKANMHLHGRPHVRSFGSLPIDKHSDLFKINKDIGGLVRARTMQQNSTQKTTTRFAREKSDSDTTTLMEYAARATASQRKGQQFNIRANLGNSENKDSIVAVDGSTATNNQFKYIVGQPNLETKIFGSQPDQIVHSRSQSSPHLYGYKSAEQRKSVFLSESNVIVEDKQSKKSRKLGKNYSVNIPVGRDKFTRAPSEHSCPDSIKNLEDTAKDDHVSPALRYLDSKQKEKGIPSIDSLMGGQVSTATEMDATRDASHATIRDNVTSSTLLNRRKMAPKKISIVRNSSLNGVKRHGDNDESSSPKAKTFDQLKPWFIHHSKIDEIYESEQYASGYGTYSQVYRGKHKRLGGQFAIKTINKRYLISDEEKQSVRREIEVQLRFHHPNIVRLYEVYEEQDKLHLVMEHATEGTLAECMPRKVSERRACKIIFQLLVAVSHLHENGILHSDIKPDNVLLNKAPPLSLPSTSKHTIAPVQTAFEVQLEQLIDDDGRVQICDFGLSRKVPNIKYFKHTGDVHKVPFTGICGSPGYFAPELLRKESYGKQTDLWSVGIIMYELIFGFSPFRPYHKCLEKPLEFLEKYPISIEAKELLSQLLVVNPVKRINAKKALQSSWFIKYGFIKFKSERENITKYI